MATLTVHTTRPDAPRTEPTLQLTLTPPSPAPNVSRRHSKLLRLDPSRALEPARKKIATLEAQRVMNVLLDTIQRAEIVAMLPYVVENLDRFRVVLGDSLVKLLEHHAVIQKTYEEVKAERDRQLQQAYEWGEEEEELGERMVSEALPSAPGMKSRQETFSSLHSEFSMSSSSSGHLMKQLSIVAGQLSHSCKNVLRAFGANHAAIKMLKSQLSELPEAPMKFLANLYELRDFLMLRLLETPNEEMEKALYVQEMSRRAQNHAEFIAELENMLARIINDKDIEVQKRNDIIRRLQIDLHQIEKMAEDSIQRLRNETEKEEQENLTETEVIRQKMLLDINQLKNQLQNLLLEHRDNEQLLRSKKYKAESEVENWIQKYDQDLDELQEEYEEIEKEYKEEKEQMEELQERFNTLEKEYKEILEERQKERERLEAAERLFSTMVKAATTLQAFWRSFKVRRVLKIRAKKKNRIKAAKKKK